MLDPATTEVGQPEAPVADFCNTDERQSLAGYSARIILNQGVPSTGSRSLPGEAGGHDDTAPCGACDGSGFVRVYPDSGTWVVEPTHRDDPRATPCPCDASLDPWRA